MLILTVEKFGNFEERNGPLSPDTGERWKIALSLTAHPEAQVYDLGQPLNFNISHKVVRREDGVGGELSISDTPETKAE